MSYAFENFEKQGNKLVGLKSVKYSGLDHLAKGIATAFFQEVRRKFNAKVNQKI